MCRSGLSKLARYSLSCIFHFYSHFMEWVRYRLCQVTKVDKKWMSSLFLQFFKKWKRSGSRAETLFWGRPALVFKPIHWSFQKFSPLNARNLFGCWMNRRRTCRFCSCLASQDVLEDWQNSTVISAFFFYYHWFSDFKYASENYDEFGIEVSTFMLLNWHPKTARQREFAIHRLEWSSLVR